jgi:maleate isomerase
MTREVVALHFETDEGLGPRARIGLIVLETDQTVEHEVREVPRDGVDWFHSRIPMQDTVDGDTLTAMEQDLPAAARLLPAEFEFDAIGYACTSAAALIGDAGVAAAIGRHHPDVPVTTPISAAADALRTLDAARVAVVTPYTEDVTWPIVEYFERAGLEVVSIGSFLEPSDFRVARISEASIAAGVRTVSETEQCDAVFVSCTSLRSLSIIPALEAELGLAVVSSNQALIWKLLRLAGINDVIENSGSLFLL